MLNLNNWSVAYGCLIGQVSGHTEIPDGNTVTSSEIISIEDSVAITSTDTKYKLGNPHQDYLKFCEAQNRSIFNLARKPYDVKTTKKESSQ